MPQMNLNSMMDEMIETTLSLSLSLSLRLSLKKGNLRVQMLKIDPAQHLPDPLRSALEFVMVDEDSGVHHPG